MYLLFDIGGTKTRIATSLDGKRIDEPVVVNTPQTFESVVEYLEKTGKELLEKNTLQAIAGGIAGPLDPLKEQLVSPANLPSEWVAKPLKKQLEAYFKVPVFLENDAALVGLGEATMGAGKGSVVVAYITVSTGVGGVRIVNKRIDTSTQGFEPGHQIINPDGPLCPACNLPGHLESFLGGEAIKKRFGTSGEQILDPAVWDELARYLAYGLANITVLWSPDTIVLGGSGMQSLPIESVQKYLKEQLRIFPKVPDIVKASLPNDKGGLYGGLALLQEKR